MNQLHLFEVVFSNLVYSPKESTLYDIILRNYLDANELGPLYYDLRYSDGLDEEGNPVNSVVANYVSGYLAALYRSDLAYRAEHGGESAVTVVDDFSVDVSTEKL